MKDYKAHWYSLTYVLAFVIGVILFWAFGKDGLDLESVPIFLAGLLGIAVAVILFGAWNIRHNSNHEEK
jgi:hypothetical protein